MKKRITAIITYLLAASILLSCAGGGGNSRENTVNVFYPDPEFMSISPVSRTISGGSVEAKTDELIKALSIIPFREELRPTLGGRAEIASKEIRDGRLHLDFTPSYNSLNKTEEVLTRAAVVETMSQIDGIHSVEFSVNKKPLRDPEGSLVGPMNADTFINDMGQEINTYDRRTLTLYYSDINGTSLKPCRQTVVYSANMSVEKLIVQKLIEGPPQGEEYYPTLPKDVGLLGVTIKNGTCYVNFDSAIREQPYNVTENVVIYSLADSLTELENVDNIQIAVDGVSDGVLFDKCSLNAAYERNMEIVK